MNVLTGIAKFEATTRIELVHSCFADSRVSTSPRGQ